MLDALDFGLGLLGAHLCVRVIFGSQFEGLLEL